MGTKVIPGLILYLLLVISLSLHEWAHGFVAYRLGDQTPKAFGRLTLNPFAHIDPIGTVLVPLAMLLLMPGFVIFGWAKPVPINSGHFDRRRRKLCELAVSLAGPFSNLVLAVLSAMLGAYLSKHFGGNIGSLFGMMCWLNIILCLFNLIPIPPLDGAYLLKVVLRISDLVFFHVSRYGFLILLVLINIPAFRAVLFACMLRVFALISWLACSIFGVQQNVLFPF
jgi:Zn-dependent protease